MLPLGISRQRLPMPWISTLLKRQRCLALDGLFFLTPGPAAPGAEPPPSTSRKLPAPNDGAQIDASEATRHCWLDPPLQSKTWRFSPAPVNGSGMSRHCAFMPTSEPATRRPYAFWTPTMSHGDGVLAELHAVWLMTDDGSSGPVPSSSPPLVRWVHVPSKCSCRKPST